MQNSVSAQVLMPNSVLSLLSASTHPTGSAEQAEVAALLHTLLQALNDLQLRVGQLEHTGHVRAALRPLRDLGIDY